MNEALTGGTLITVVGADWCLATRVVSRPTNGNVSRGYFHVTSPEGAPMNALHTSQEGVAWIRGHYDPRSHVVDACRVAQALQVKPEEPKPAAPELSPFAQGVLKMTERLMAQVLANRAVKK